MELFAARGYFFCRYCGSFHFPDAAGADGVRVMGQSREGLSCAVCDRPLSSALLDDTHPIQYCQKCRGVLIARSAFASVVHKRRAWATGQPGPPVPLNRSEFNRKMNCPSCKAPMATHPYYGPGNVVIDTCEPCENVWLDFGELKQIVAAPGKDRGTREHVPRDVGNTPAGPGVSGPIEPLRVDLLDLLSRFF